MCFNTTRSLCSCPNNLKFHMKCITCWTRSLALRFPVKPIRDIRDNFCVCLVFGHWVRWNATKESGSKVKFTTRQKITFYTCLLTLFKHWYDDRTVCRITASRRASKHFRTAKFSALWMLWAPVSRAAPIHWRAFGRIPVLAYNCACSYTFLIINTKICNDGIRSIPWNNAVRCMAPSISIAWEWLITMLRPREADYISGNGCFRHGIMQTLNVLHIWFTENNWQIH